MTCKKCGSTLPENAKFCTVCGSQIEVYEQTAPVTQTPAEPAMPTYAAPVQPTYAAPAVPEMAKTKIPEEYEPLGPWAYFGYSLLFSIPIVGFILLIVFSCKNSNINRRNYARSYWCGLIIAAIIVAIYLIIALIAGAGIMSALR